MNNFPFSSNGVEVVTDSAGYYTAIDVPTPWGSDYPSFGPYRNEDLKKGVIARDVLLLQKHLLGRQRFSDPEQYIAADINSSESITVLDLVLLKKILLGARATLPVNSSWRIIRLDYFFPYPAMHGLCLWFKAKFFKI